MNKLKNKRITDKIIRYTINSILMPQIEYLTLNLVPKEKLIKKIDSKIRRAFRQKCALSKVFPNVAIHRILGYNLFSFKDHLKICIGSEFMAHLNLKHINGITTKIRLQAIQNTVWINKTLWEINWNKVNWLKLRCHALNCIKFLKANGFKIVPLNNKEFPVYLGGGSISLYGVINNH